MSGVSILLASMMLISISLVSCWHRTKASKPHQTVHINYSLLFNKLQGTWISYEYMLNLNKTKSPSQSAAFMEGVFSFSIDSVHLNDDTVHCLSWVNGREERDFWIAFDSPDSFGLYSIGINRSEKSDADNQNADNITRIKIDSPYLIIYTNIYDSVRYIHYANLPRNTAADYPIKHYTTAALFRGEYYTTDSGMVFGSSVIYFDPNNIGRIAGSPVYDSFDINVNVLSQNDSVDYMELFDSRKQNESRSFIYRQKKNILRIYPSRDSIPCTLHKTHPEDTLLYP